MIRLLLLISLATLLSPLAPAWGPEGHHAIARVAEELVDEGALRRFRYLMGAESHFEDFAWWAQEVIDERPDSEAWHSITVPPNATRLDLRRDCPVGDCTPAKIRECIGIVRLAQKDRDQREDAMKFLIHLAGDLHQPLHAGYPPGGGGDGIRVVYQGRPMSLEDFWEEPVLGGRDVEELAAAIRSRITPEREREWRRGAIQDWTWDTHLTAVRVAYGALPNGETKRLTEDYTGPAWAAAQEQMAKAAVRLAAIMEDIWP